MTRHTRICSPSSRSDGDSRGATAVSVRDRLPDARLGRGGGGRRSGRVPALPRSRRRSGVAEGVPGNGDDEACRSTSCAPHAPAARSIRASGCRSRSSRTRRSGTPRPPTHSPWRSCTCSRSSLPSSGRCSSCARCSTTPTRTSRGSSARAPPTAGRSSPARTGTSRRAGRRFDVSREEREEVARRFIAAWEEGDTEGLMALLAPDATVYGDGGGKAPAMPVPLVGAERVAKALIGWGRQARRPRDRAPARARQRRARSRVPRAGRPRALGRRARGRRGRGRGRQVGAEPRQARAPRARLGLGRAGVRLLVGDGLGGMLGRWWRSRCSSSLTTFR